MQHSSHVMLKKLDRYIIINFLGTFFFLLGAFSLIAIVIDFTEKINDFVDKKAPILAILNYFKNFLPYIWALLFPIFIFVAVIFFTSRLANRSEIIAMLCSGMTFKRFLRPYVLGAAILSLLLFFANHYWIPKANKQKLNFEEKYIWEHKYSVNDNFHVRISKNEYIYMQSFNPETKSGFRFSYEKIANNQIIEKINAERCDYDSVNNSWTLFNGDERILNDIKENYKKFVESKYKFSFTPADLVERREAKQYMTTPVLNDFLNKEKMKGSMDLSEYSIEYHRRSASPFSAFVLSIIGACIASRKVRGGSGVHLALGLMISAIYIFLMQFTTTFSIKGNLHPFLSVWIPNVLFGILAYFIYKKFSK